MYVGSIYPENFNRGIQENKESNAIRQEPGIQDNKSHDPLKVEISPSDSILASRFNVKSFIGFDLIAEYLENPSLFEGTTFKELLEIVENTLVTQRSTVSHSEKINTLPKEVMNELVSIANTHYLGHLASQDDLIPFLSKFYLELSQKLSDEQVMNLLRAEAQSGDALDSFLDNILATKGYLSKDTSMYSKTSEDVMNETLNKIYNICEISPIDFLLQKGDSYVIPAKDYQPNWVCSNFVDLIAYESLLNDDFPLGYIKFSFIMTHYFNKKLDFTLTFYQHKRIIKTYTITYDLNKNIVEINNNHSKDTLSCAMTHRVIHILKGHIQGRKVKMKIYYDKNQMYEEKLSIEPWESSRILNKNHQEYGHFVNNKTYVNKPLHMTYDVRRTNDNQVLVFKKVNVGEDQFKVSYVFKETFPVPIMASGIIINRRSLFESTGNDTLFKGSIFQV